MSFDDCQKQHQRNLINSLLFRSPNLGRRDIVYQHAVGVFTATVTTVQLVVKPRQELPISES